MDRRNTRLRREYLYRKSLEAGEKAEYDKKMRLKTALEEGKPIPTELRKESAALKRKLETDDPTAVELKTHVDDEYQKVRGRPGSVSTVLSPAPPRHARYPPPSPHPRPSSFPQMGVYDPKILITSSRDASSRLTQFVKELRYCFPGAQRMNRGNTVMKEIVDLCRQGDFTDLIIVHEHRGEPDGLIVCHFPYGPTAYFGLTNCVLRHDLSVDVGSVSEAAPHLIFHNFSTALGQRTQTVLKALFPVPKEDSRRVMTFVNRDDTVSFRHHVYRKVGAQERAADPTRKDIELAEVGPRFELKLYQIKLGTVDMAEAENEWVLRPYMNTAKKRKAL